MLDLEIGTVLHVKTFGSAFIVQKRADGFWVWGNPRVPVPTPLHQLYAKGFPKEDLIIESVIYVDNIV